MKISLKAARVNANLTQQEVADKIKVSKDWTIVNKVDTKILKKRQKSLPY